MGVNLHKAFPRAGCDWTEDHGDDAFAQDGMDLLDYFAAHAPEQQWSFEPWMPRPRPEACLADNGQDGRVVVNQHEIDEWNKERRRQVAIQWPWVWAHAMIAERTRT